MEYVSNSIEQILSKRLCNRCKIHKLLEIDAHLYTQLGRTSTSREREEVKRMSKKIYTQINKIDSEIGKILLSSMD